VVIDDRDIEGIAGDETADRPGIRVSATAAFTYALAAPAELSCLIAILRALWQSRPAATARAVAVLC
jgi:hypothetical protein